MTALAAKHFTAAEVFLLTGVPPEKQYQWKDRRTIVPSRQDKRPNGSGDYSLTSIETVYQYAITAALLRLGVTPKYSAPAARKFADHSNPGRAAGELFPQQRTVLCLRESGTVVINAPYHADFCDLSDHGTAFIAIDCGKICKEVDEAIHKHNLK